MKDAKPESDAARVAALALAEDGPVDVSSEVAVPPDARGFGVIEFRSSGVLAGCPYADAVARAVGLEPVAWCAAEGARIPAPGPVGQLKGGLRALLRAERPMLNLLQRASGIATLTRQFVDAVAGTPARILHTRKTAPGLRQLDVSAVLAGGGHRHRLGLDRTLMIKDNHWRVLVRSGRTLAAALADARGRGVTDCQVEVESLEQLREACLAGATRLLIDNQKPETVVAWARAARALAPAIETEATGGITLANVRAYAEAGADFISVGALTHSVQAADIAMTLGW
jgi:nicotinate-nucleotide pyrophosphorylase (carboxylating)